MGREDFSQYVSLAQQTAPSLSQFLVENSAAKIDDTPVHNIGLGIGGQQTKKDGTSVFREPFNDVR